MERGKADSASKAGRVAERACEDGRKFQAERKVMARLDHCRSKKRVVTFGPEYAEMLQSRHHQLLPFSSL